MSKRERRAAVAAPALRQRAASNGPVHCKSLKADVAQLVEQPIRNRQVSGSTPLVGSILSITFDQFTATCCTTCCTSYLEVARICPQTSHVLTIQYRGDKGLMMTVSCHDDLR